jgi:hypothetical protein
MTDMTEQTIFEGTHPAPHRRNASPLALGFGLAAAPLAWVAQTIIGYALASYTCFPGDTPRAAPLFAHTRSILLALNAAAIIVAVLGAAVAYASWSATKQERARRPRDIVDVGEGRTRFLAICGLLTSIGFLVATIFASPAIVVIPLCR